MNETGSPNESAASLSKPSFNIVVVGGSPFALADSDIQALGSEFLTHLTTLTDGDTEKSLDDNVTVHVYHVDRADPECFSAFVHMARYGSLPVTMVSKKKNLLMEQSKFWCIDEKVSEVLEKEKKEVKPMNWKSSLERVVQTKTAALESSKHHNHREDDGFGRIYCTICRNRDIDSRWYPRWGTTTYGHEDYARCVSCSTMVKYNPVLNWCHKCRRCKSCQGHKCKADNPMRAGNYYLANRMKSTLELEKEAEELMKDMEG